MTVPRLYPVDLLALKRRAGKNAILLTRCVLQHGWLYSGVCITIKKIVLRGSPVAQR